MAKCNEDVLYQGALQPDYRLAITAYFLKSDGYKVKYLNLDDSLVIPVETGTDLYISEDYSEQGAYDPVNRNSASRRLLQLVENCFALAKKPGKRAVSGFAFAGRVLEQDMEALARFCTSGIEALVKCPRPDIHRHSSPSIATPIARAP